MIRSTTHGIGRRASFTTSAMTYGWKTMSAAKSTVIFLQCAACAAHKETNMRMWIAIAIFTISTLAASASGQTPAKNAIPELASTTFAWQAVGADWLDAPAGLRGPIKADP